MKKLVIVVACLLLPSFSAFGEDALYAPQNEFISQGQTNSNTVYSAHGRIANFNQPFTVAQNTFVQVPLNHVPSDFGGLVVDETRTIGGKNIKITEFGVYSTHVRLNFSNNRTGQVAYRLTREYLNEAGQPVEEILVDQYFNTVGGGLQTAINGHYALKLWKDDIIRVYAWQNGEPAGVTMGNWSQMAVTKIGELRTKSDN